MDDFYIGQTLKIERTDGRIHTAEVCVIKEDEKSLIFTWDESSGPKYKEIPLDLIRVLNPEDQDEQHKALEVKKQTLMSKLGNLAPSAIGGGMGKVNKTFHKVPISKSDGVASGTTTYRGNLSKKQKSTTGANTTGLNERCASAIEKIKINREKRRATLAKEKEDKVARMNRDPGNPNWETAQMIREYRNSLVCAPLLDGQTAGDHQITVCLRKRPLSRKEVTKKDIDVISVPCKDTLIVHEPRTKVDLTKFLEHHKFRFDYVFNEQCDNAMVYKYTAKPLIESIFEGNNATCIAYGQTGSGKTHTMSGDLNSSDMGIVALAARDVFGLLKSPRYRSQKFIVSVNFFEIYSGKVFDLIDKSELRVLEDANQQVHIVGLTETVVDSVEKVLHLLWRYTMCRSTGQTSANPNSSRSHAVFQIVLRLPDTTLLHGKLAIVDLAGNERGVDTTSANMQTRMESALINKSLLALKECIRALSKGQSRHLPFRLSKLTQVLRDCFIGEKNKTCMIGMISPGLSSCEHTLNTLRYADRVKELHVKDTPDVLRKDKKVKGADRRTLKLQRHHKKPPLRSPSTRKQDMPDKSLVQQPVITELKQTEQNAIMQHHSVNAFMNQFLIDSKSLHDLTKTDDYDRKAYCRKGEKMLSDLIDMSIICRHNMTAYRAKLAEKETTTNTKRKNYISASPPLPPPRRGSESVPGSPQHFRTRIHYTPEPQRRIYRTIDQ